MPAARAPATGQAGAAARDRPRRRPVAEFPPLATARRSAHAAISRTLPIGFNVTALYATQCLIAHGGHRYDGRPSRSPFEHFTLSRGVRHSGFAVANFHRVYTAMLRTVLTFALILSWQLTPSHGKDQPWQAGVARV